MLVHHDGECFHTPVCVSEEVEAVLYRGQSLLADHSLPRVLVSISHHAGMQLYIVNGPQAER